MIIEALFKVNPKEFIDHASSPQEMREVLMTLGHGRATATAIVSEMYSPPRVAREAGRHRSLHIAGGTSFDLKTCDETGKPWDFIHAAEGLHVLSGGYCPS